MRHFVGAFALLSLALTACVGDLSDPAEGQSAETGAKVEAPALVNEGKAIHAAPGKPVKSDKTEADRSKSTESADDSSDTAKPQTDPWAPVEDGEVVPGANQRPQTDPWKPTPGLVEATGH